ncbi:hypothetical protein MK489_09615, partial [Myxococcota bacterium]|nr:hypothetical protein [Myxococcota bacterium]
MLRMKYAYRSLGFWVGMGLVLSALPVTALNILLTNDDGIDAPGIQALGEALKGAGHRVVIVAPNRNYSGTSASMTFEAISVE